VRRCLAVAVSCGAIAAELCLLPLHIGSGAGLATFALAAESPEPKPDGVPVSRWRSPLDGPLRVARRFEPPVSRYGRGHRGVDLQAEAGAVVRAAGAGVVAFAGPVGGRGVISIDHRDALRTTYEPVTPLVRAGTVVAVGTVIGRLSGGHAPGLTACAAGCLHWGLRFLDRYFDPLSLLGSGPVRLYPLRSSVAGPVPGEQGP
jgi:murein DD-endopeptidase MepM/ murein hydrolase activator NlpD